jgi:hypothetical protein
MGNILLSSIGGGMPGLWGGAYIVAPVTYVGVYASLESGLELSGVLPGRPVGVWGG